MPGNMSHAGQPGAAGSQERGRGSLPGWLGSPCPVNVEILQAKTYGEIFWEPSINSGEPGEPCNSYPLLRAARKFNRQSETYETLEDYGDLWLKMFGASVVCGKNFGVHEWPLRKWRFLGFWATAGGCGGGKPSNFGYLVGRVGASVTIHLQRICGYIMYGRVAVLFTPRKKPARSKKQLWTNYR